LAIKWKNNNQKSIAYVCAVTMVITLGFVSLFPYFKQSVRKVYEDPRISAKFIEMLYGDTYIQYKYLREKADQKQYTYPELFVDAQLMDTLVIDQETGEYLAEKDPFLDTNDKEQIDFCIENSIQEINEFRDCSPDLNMYLDYYAYDTNTGKYITNGDKEQLDALMKLGFEGNTDYTYYVSVTYDSAGNIEDCDAAILDENNQGYFRKLAEQIGRENLFRMYDEYGSCYPEIQSEQEARIYRYKLTLNRPRDMKIIYAMTEEQSLHFADLNGMHFFFADQEYLKLRSYKEAGVFSTFLGFAIAAAAAGFCSVLVFGKKERKWYVYHKLPICSLPFEVIGCILFMALVLSDSVIGILVSYQEGWFWEDFNRTFLAPLHFSWLIDIVVLMIFWCCFWFAFTVGSYFANMFPVANYIKTRSILYRYWDKIIHAVRKGMKSFYQEIVNHDIGKDANKLLIKLVVINFAVLFLISLFWVFGVVALAVYSLILYLLAKRYVRDIQQKYNSLLKATSAIANGNLDNALSEEFGVFESYKEELRNIQTDFKKAVDQEVKSQRMKSELITNVSHDLKTPLTAIITYINLLKEPDLTDAQREEYIRTLDKKAARLKTLIEDLFEVSKANSQNITLQLTQVDIRNLVRQCYLEYEDRFEAANLQVKFMMPDEKILLHLDPQKTFRIFENLFINIIKYALASTRVYITLHNLEDEVMIELKNISSMELQVEAEELTERFVRGDGSRNTEGSGLGLAIARSFTELQHGTLSIQIDGDLFKVILRFKKEI